MREDIKKLLKEVLQSVDVTNLPSSEVKKLQTKNKNKKDIVYVSSDEKPGDNKGLSEAEDIEDILISNAKKIYDRIKKDKSYRDMFNFKSTIKFSEIDRNNITSEQAAQLNKFKVDLKQDDPFAFLENYVKNYVKKYLNEQVKFSQKKESIGSLESMPTDDDIMLQRFPNLKEVLKELMGNDYKLFITDIKYIAPKPSTFQIKLGDEHFNLIWGGQKIKFICEIQGKKYHTIYLKEKEQAIKAINRLLRLGSTTSTQPEQEPESPSNVDTSSPQETPKPTNKTTEVSPEELSTEI